MTGANRKLSILIMQCVRKVPLTLLKKAVRILQVLDCKEFFKVLKQLSGLHKSSKIAQSFDTRSLIKEQKPLTSTFASYLQDLYQSDITDSHKLTSTKVLTPPSIPISYEEVRDALKHTGHKATGVDQLSSRVLKHAGLKVDIVRKLTASFNQWMNEGDYPSYLKHSNIIPLSKEDN